MKTLTVRWCVFALLMTAPATGASAQAGVLLDPQPTGQLIDVGGYRVHLVCTGSAPPSAPTVLIVGAGASFEWGLVIPAIAERTRVCAYDHSGTVWSDDGPTDSCELRVHEVTAALRAAHIAGPFVVVGHSIGALVARLFADRHADLTAGMIFVDHATSVPVRNVSLPGSTSDAARTPPLGATPVMGARMPAGEAAFSKLAAADRALHQWATSRPRDQASRQHSPAILPGCEAVLRSSATRRAAMGNRPLVILHVNDGEVISPTSGTSPYAQLQQRLAMLSTKSRIVQVDHSSHYIMLDRPDAVVAAIREVLDQVATQAPR
ncbi:MAG: alpha/beta hydrolase [Gemmatimonadaceae bacterium]